MKSRPDSASLQSRTTTSLKQAGIAGLLFAWPPCVLTQGLSQVLKAASAGARQPLRALNGVPYGKRPEGRCGGIHATSRRHGRLRHAAIRSGNQLLVQRHAFHGRRSARMQYRSNRRCEPALTL